MNKQRILAKSLNGETLLAHSIKCDRIACKLANLGILKLMIKAFNLQGEFASEEYIEKTLRIAILTHDLGKANSHMQKTLQGNSKFKNLIRHEIVSAYKLLVLKEELRTRSFNFDAVFFAVVNHHLKPQITVAKENTGDRMEICDLKSSQQYKHLIKYICKIAGVDSKPALQKISRLSQKQFTKDDAEKRVAQIKSISKSSNLSFSIIKSLLIFCDSIASSILDIDKQLEWVDNALVKNNVSAEELQVLVDLKLKGNKPYKYQQEIHEKAMLNRVAVLIPATGTGKTCAALMRSNAIAETVGRIKVFFALPTRSLTSTMFSELELLEKLAPGKPGLVHSTASIDLERILSNDDKDKEDLEEKAVSLQGLDLIQTSFVCVTTHTLLGFLQNSRMGLLALPAIAQGHVIFDEAHCGGREVFRHMLEFIRLTNIPITIMSATLHPEQIEEIRQAAGGNITVIRGDDEHENTPKYRITTIKKKDALDKAIYEAKQGKKVLWICNTVGRVQRYYQEVKQQFDNTHILHARFIPDHRLQKTEALIKAFRQDGAVIAIANQTAEQCLDISADVIIVEACPGYAYIQRPGRCVRYQHQGIGDVYVYDPGSCHPYTQEEVTEWMNLTKSIEGKVVSKSELRNLYDSSNIKFQEDEPITFGFMESSAKTHTYRKSIGDYDSVSIVPTAYIKPKMTNNDCKRYAIAVPTQGREFTIIQKTWFYQQQSDTIYDEEIGLYNIRDKVHPDAIII